MILAIFHFQGTSSHCKNIVGLGRRRLTVESVRGRSGPLLAKIRSTGGSIHDRAEYRGHETDCLILSGAVGLYNTGEPLPVSVFYGMLDITMP